MKLEVGLGFEVPALDGVVAGAAAEALTDVSLRAVYVDTPTLRLMRAGVTLRHRRDGRAGAHGERGWTLKLPAAPDGRGLVRKELTWPGSPGSLPRQAASLVRALQGGEDLGAVARLLTRRRRTLLRDAAGAPLVEIDDDVVSVMDGRRLAARFREVEVEVVGPGGGQVLGAVVGRLESAGAVLGDDRPKVVRALGRRATQPPDVVVARLGPGSTLGEVVGAAIAAGYCRLVSHDPGVRLDQDDEDVHQARVATRRLRSDLQTFGTLLDDAWAGPVRDELGWLAAALGRVRDADVLGARLARQVEGLAGADHDGAAPLFRRLAAARREARRDLAAAMDSDRYLDLLRILAAGALDPPLRRRPPAGIPATAPSCTR